MVGPRLISTILAGAPKEVRVSSIKDARSLSMLLSMLTMVAGSRMVFISGSFHWLEVVFWVTDGCKRDAVAVDGAAW